MQNGSSVPQVASIRNLTEAPFGLNLLLFFTENLLDAALATRPPIMAFAWAASDQRLGAIFGRAHDARCNVVYQAASVPEAVRAAKAGADIIVAQGTEAGGHVGVMGTMPLVPMVVDAVHTTPVLAAGGIADGRGLAAALALGADGVLLGTRFLATVESPLPASLKQAILKSDGHDTDLASLPDMMYGTVWPGALARVRRNALIRRWAGREWEMRLHRQQIAAEANAARRAGDAEEAILYYGQDAGLIKAIEPAGTIVTWIVREAQEILMRRPPSLAASVEPKGTRSIDNSKGVRHT